MITPKCLALLICREVRNDGCGGRSLVGLLAVARYARFPAVADRLWVYVDVTDGRGCQDMQIQIVDDDGAVLAERSVRVDFANAAEDQTATVPFDQVCFEREGMHYVRLYAKGELLVERTLMVAVSHAGAPASR